MLVGTPPSTLERAGASEELCCLHYFNLMGKLLLANHNFENDIESCVVFKDEKTGWSRPFNCHEMGSKFEPNLESAFLYQKREWHTDDSG